MTDFRPILADLDAKGYGVNKIAMRLKRQFIQIQRVKDSETGQVNYDLGIELLNLHQEVCGPALQIVPHQPTIEMRMA